MESLGPLQLVYCMLVLTAAFAVRGTTGFGGGAVAVPLLALALPLPVVVPVVAVLNNLSSIRHGIRDWRKIVWAEILRAAPFSLIGVIAGVYLFKVLDSQTLTRAFGVFIISYAVFALATASRVKAPPRALLWPLVVTLSILAGIVGMVFGGAAAPLYVIYLSTLRMEKDRFRVTITTILFVQGLMRVVGYFKLGFYDMNSLLMLAGALPAMLIGSRIGDRVAVRIDQRTFNRIVGAILMCSGVALLFK